MSQQVKITCARLHGSAVYLGEVTGPDGTEAPWAGGICNEPQTTHRPMTAKGIHLIHQVEDVKSVAPPRNEPNRAIPRAKKGGKSPGLSPAQQLLLLLI
jgi:hypothetical protein